MIDNEIKCPHCNGTGILKYCSICHNKGTIENIRWEGKLFNGWIIKPCPNGCQPSKGKYIA